MDKKQTWNLGYWAVAILLRVTLQDFWRGASESQAVSYSDLQTSASAAGRPQPRPMVD